MRFTRSVVQASQRRRRSQEQKKIAGNQRAAVEAAVRNAEHPFPAGKLPVRGLPRVTCMVSGSAAATNLRRIQRFLTANKQGETTQAPSPDGQNRASAQELQVFLSSNPHR